MGAALPLGTCKRISSVPWRTLKSSSSSTPSTFQIIASVQLLAWVNGENERRWREDSSRPKRRQEAWSEQVQTLLLMRISHPANLKALSTLTMAHNKLDTKESLRGLLECPSLRVLDLSHNRITDPSIVDVCRGLLLFSLLSFYSSFISHFIECPPPPLSTRLFFLFHILSILPCLRCFQRCQIYVYWIWWAIQWFVAFRTIARLWSWPARHSVCVENGSLEMTFAILLCKYMYMIFGDEGIRSRQMSRKND